MKNKAALLFILKFFISYLILAGVYQFYLTQFTAKQAPNQVDYITEKVAYQSVFLGTKMGYNIKTEPSVDEKSMKLIYQDKYVARVVEGCNAISVLILFWAFIIAFSGKWLETFIFGSIGSLLIYVINLFRIFILTQAIYNHPEHSSFLHKIVFPSIIYGFTFILWVVWVKRLEKIKIKS